MYSTDVYADVLFLINLAMDALCLTVTARLMHASPHKLRLLAAAVIGGVYGIVALFLETSSVMAFALDVAVCVLMCAIYMGRRKLWFVSGLYLLTSMVMGGIMTGLYHWLNRLGADAFLPQGEESLSTLSFVILAALGSAFTFVWGRIFRSSERKRARDVLVSIIFRGRRVNLRGMVDSGNLLTDPISGTPVIIVKKTAVMSLFSEEMAEALSKDDLPTGSSHLWPEAPYIRLIPVKTATGEGLLTGIRPHEITLTIEGKNPKPQKINALISPAALDEQATDALIPSSLIL